MEQKDAVQFDTIETALNALADGRMIVVVDDEDRENEGDLIIAAEFANPEKVNFMALYGRGLICAGIDQACADRLGLWIANAGNQPGALHGTAFTESVDYLHGTTTGISASDRSATFRALAQSSSKGSDFGRPGHVFPLIAKSGGVLERRGHTEATVDLCRLAGLSGVGVLCEVLDPDGSMARVRSLSRLAQKHRLPLISVEALVQWRRQHEELIIERERVRMPLKQGQFELSLHVDLYQSQHGAEIPVLSHSRHGLSPKHIPLVRVHSECLTGDVFGSLRCDCGAQLEASLGLIVDDGLGAVIYLRQEGRGIGLSAKLRAYHLQEQGMDTYDANTAQGLPADARDYWQAAQILHAWGWKRVRLLTNNPEKVLGLERYGIEVVERLSLDVGASPENEMYRKTKAARFGHILNVASKSDKE